MYACRYECTRAGMNVCLNVYAGNVDMRVCSVCVFLHTYVCMYAFVGMDFLCRRPMRCSDLFACVAQAEIVKVSD